MSNPVINSPYKEPECHWKLLESGNMTNTVLDGRRQSMHFIPVPKPEGDGKLELLLPENEEKTKVNAIRKLVKEWRDTPLEKRTYISSVTKKLLAHWYDKKENRLFFCQLEAAETFIWLNEVAPRTKIGADLIQYLRDANKEANPDLFRLAAKMATGAGKTTVMAMLIAYHAVNKARRPNSSLYSLHFLIITPGITIKDRLRVLLPNDPENYYKHRGIVPRDMLPDVKRSTVIITNYHTFKRRQTVKISRAQRDVIIGNNGEGPDTEETDWQMMRRICPELLEAKNAVVINDEAHHCYIHKTRKTAKEESEISEEEKEDVSRNNKAARLWINGIMALGRKIKIQSVYDLSATPFFLRGSGYREGTLFPWVASDFSLMEAIESGIVKLPRVPVQDTAGGKMPVYRDLYERIRKGLPKGGQGKQAHTDSQHLPTELMGAMTALYSHYEKTYKVWQEKEIDVPPVLIIVCNNTSTSKMLYDRISGYEINNAWRRGEFDLFNNVADSGDKLRARPRTLLIDSYQLESGEALTPEFKKAAATEIEVFKEEMRIRYPERAAGKITDEDLLREVMNTVGKKDKLGEQIRCVISVSMLTEGWDTNNVTHILGVRGFGTQLLCEQVVGRALRRFSYEVGKDDRFSPQYAEVLGVPFSFMSEGKNVAPSPPPKTTRVRHMDERAELAITFPNLDGYRVQPPEEGLTANFDKNSYLDIEADSAPQKTKQQGVAGEDEILTLDDLRKRRMSEVEFELAAYICRNYYQAENQEGSVSPARFRDLLPIVRHYIEKYVRCHNTFKQYLLWGSFKRQAAERIQRAIVPKKINGKERLLPMLHPYTPEGSTFYVDFMTGKKRLHTTAEDKSHINIAVCDSDWEMWFCECLEAEDSVFSYARNERLEFEVPYKDQGRWRKYLPDFIVLIDDGNGRGDLLNLVVEIKGFRDGNAQAKANTMERLWVPAVNNSGKWGRWRFLEIMDPQDMQPQAKQKVLKQYAKNGWKRL